MTFKRTYTDEQLIAAVKECNTLRGICRALNLNGTGTTVLKKHIARLGLDTSHFVGRHHSRGIPNDWSKVKLPLDKILIENSAYGRSDSLKPRLLKAGLLINMCAICGLGPQWQKQPLTLHLDHINGKRTDNRLENLRILCPNCHTQTSTYAGRNIPKQGKPEPKWKCEQCSKAIRKGCKLCLQCYVGINGRKLNIDEGRMVKDLKTKSIAQLAGELGIDPTTIDRRLKKLGLTVAMIRHPERAVLSDDNINAIRTRFWVSGLDYQEIAAEYNTTNEIVGNIIRRRTWKELPFVVGEKPVSR